MAAGNLAVYFLTRSEVDKIYGHFNLQDYMTNLNEEAKSAIKQTTRAENKKLTAKELLLHREKMNKSYALYSNLQ